MANERIRILIADDHEMVREGLAGMLSTQRDLQVVGTASDGLEAVRKAAELQPDVTLMDLNMPNMDGAGAIRQIKEQQPTAKIVVLTAYDTDERILDAIQAGAQGYLLKGTPREELFRAVRVVHQGGSLLEPTVAAKLLGHLGQLLRRDDDPDALTERELEVLQLMVRGLRNREIAEQLYITERTVKFHAGVIFQKLKVASRAEAIAVAIQRGLVRL
ncbi:MAG: response regulator transcription factor [Chloroflexi bacterium]|jgi:NarL family two-component system response regulator LiaR|nr:response regulator transcription factor [Chloroflexota bacterium]